MAETWRKGVSLSHQDGGDQPTGCVASRRLLEVEARYLSAEGEPVHTTVSELDSDRLVRGQPVRDIPTYSVQKNYPGLFWSATTGSLIRYECLLERSRLLLADYAADATWIASQPVWFIGRDGDGVHKHVPDLLLKLRDGGNLLVDVKPAKIVSRPEAVAQFRWTSRI